MCTDNRMLANGLTAGASYDGRTSVTGGRHNLPLFATSFIGREQEIATIRRRLRGTRVLTLCGPGGCGKTRLAIAAAARQVGTQPDGTWLVAGATATVLGIQPAPDQQAVEALVTHVADRRMLLLLDGCERLIDACST